MGNQYNKNCIIIYLLYNRYSGSDISILVRDAIMEPVRKL